MKIFARVANALRAVRGRSTIHGLCNNHFTRQTSRTSTVGVVFRCLSCFRRKHDLYLNSHNISTCSVENGHTSGGGDPPQHTTLTLTVYSDASWSEKLKAWFAAVYMIDSEHRILETRCFVKHENVKVPQVSYQGELFGFYRAIQMVQRLEGLHSYAAIVFRTDSNEVAEQINGIGRFKLGYERHFGNEIADVKAAWSSLQEHDFDVSLTSIRRKYNRVTDALAAHMKELALEQVQERYVSTHEIWTSEDGLAVNISDKSEILKFLSIEERSKNNFKLPPSSPSPLFKRRWQNRHGRVDRVGSQVSSSYKEHDSSTFKGGNSSFSKFCDGD